MKLSMNNLVIFDIDNTIANTWPSFGENYQNESERLFELKIFDNMFLMIKNYYNNTDAKLIFLTARDYRYFSVTKKWLKKHDIYDNNLFMVSKPSEKIILLNTSMVKLNQC